MTNKNQLINSIFYPRKSVKPKDEKDYLIEVDENINVGCRFFINDISFDNIIFFHGNAELAQEYDDIASYYNEYKLNFIVCDYRGYGLSNDSPNKDNLHSDSLVIFKYIHKYFKDNKLTGKIIIMGRSLGSASACEIINKHEKFVDGCIIESGFVTEYPLLELMGIDYKSIKFELEDGFMNLEKIKKYKKPLYVIHSDLDTIVPMSQAEMLILESSSTNKDLFKVNGANHNNIIMIAREQYFINIKSFIDSI